MSQLNVSIRDKGGEIGRAGFSLAVAGTTTQADLGVIEFDLRAVLDPLILGVIAKTTVNLEYFENDGVPAANFAQREIGLRVLMSGLLSNNDYSVTIPTPDLDILTLQANSDDVLLADAGVMQNLVDWIESEVEYPFGAGAEGVEVTRAYIVGRNN